MRRSGLTVRCYRFPAEEPDQGKSRKNEWHAESQTESCTEGCRLGITASVLLDVAAGKTAVRGTSDDETDGDVVVEGGADMLAGPALEDSGRMVAMVAMPKSNWLIAE